MLDSTFQILADHPVALPAFLFGIWIASRFLQARRSQVTDLGKYITAIAMGPLFLVLFLAEFTDHRFWQNVADSVVQFESAAVTLVFSFVDAVFAAWLRVFLLVLSGLWAAVRETVSAAVPVLTAQEFLLTVFGFEFLAGVALVYALHQSSHTAVNSWLTGIGVVMLISGVFTTLLSLDTWRVGESVLAAGLLAAMLGLASGVSSTIVIVGPDFSGQSVLPDLEEVWLRSGTSKASDGLKEFVKQTMNRLEGLFSKRQN